MSVEKEIRVQERERLIASAVEMLLLDERVTAAWMYGSLGRGTEDAWSDLDIWIVVEDSAFDEISTCRRDFARRLGEPLLFVEAPQNGPPDGMYLMAVYDAPTGPHMADWRFQPVRSAWKPDSKRILFEKRPLPVANREIPFNGNATWSPTAEEDDINKASLCLVMILVQGKCIARDPAAVGMEFESFILSLLRDILAFRGIAFEQLQDPGVLDVITKLETLSRYVDELSAFVPEFSEPGKAVARFLQVVGRSAAPTA